jgi:hypothetical protein
MGKLTANLASFALANPDNTNTLSVSLDISGGILEDATAIDAAAFITLCYVDGEFMSYQNVAETGEFDFDLTTLYRALYGSAGAAHVIGDDFVRLDETIFRYPVPQQFIGETIYLKFQSYNQFGGGVQDLASCTAYPFTVSGYSFGTGAGGVPSVPTGLASTSGAGLVRLTWNGPLPNDGVISYQIFRAVGSSQTFGSAVQIDQVSSNSRSYTDNTGTPNQPYTYFIRGVNSVGASAATSGVNGTPTPSGVDIWSVSATGTGVSQDITLPSTISNTDRYRVFVFTNGLRAATTEYSIAGTTLTITTNEAGDVIQIVGIAQ